MNLRNSVLLAALLYSCGFFRSHDERSAAADMRSESLRATYETRLAEYQELTDPDFGWPSIHDCDATLWAGEVCWAGAEVSILRAEYNPGEIQRRPVLTCYPEESASTVSNDMLLGYLACLWRTQDLDALQRLADYGEAHNWRMGEPADEDRVYMRPNQQGLLGRMLSKLGDHRSYADIPPLYLPVEKDYEQHLQVIGILLNSEVDDQAQLALDVDGVMFGRLQALAEDENDALMQAAYGRYTGDMSRALDLLLSETPIPSYVRGDDNYALVYWLKAASVVLQAYP